MLSNDPKAHIDASVQAVRRAFYGLQSSGMCEGRVSPVVSAHRYKVAIQPVFHKKYKTLYNSVPTSDSDLSNIKNTLVERLHPSEVSNLDHVTPELICHCIVN